MSCIKQKHEDESDFLLDDQSEMSLSLAGLSVSRSGNCREPICTKCHVVTKMKYKFAKYRTVPISEKQTYYSLSYRAYNPLWISFSIKFLSCSSLDSNCVKKIPYWKPRNSEKVAFLNKSQKINRTLRKTSSCSKLLWPVCTACKGPVPFSEITMSFMNPWIYFKTGITQQSHRKKDSGKEFVSPYDNMSKILWSIMRCKLQFWGFYKNRNCISSSTNHMALNHHVIWS